MLRDALPHEFYCTLCGVPFKSYYEVNRSGSEDDPDDIIWLSYHLALRIPKGTAIGTATGPNSGLRITGIGQYDRQQPRIPPPGYDIRDILKGVTRGPGRIKLREAWENTDKSVYLMHPCCWDILLQQHAIIASPTKPCLDLNELGKIFLQVPLSSKGGGFRPDWATDYAGPEQIWWSDEEIFLKQLPERDFLARDPGLALGFDELLANPPLESATKISPPIQFADDGGDIFARLPAEILTEILVLLPSASVRDLQLASRKVVSVHLSSRYWRSRFEFPNELCHITLPPALLKSGQVGEQWVDWRRLCDQLLHPVGEGFGWWQNRKRITALNRQLVQSMSLRGSDGRLKEV